MSCLRVKLLLLLFLISAISCADLSGRIKAVKGGIFKPRGDLISREKVIADNGQLIQVSQGRNKAILTGQKIINRKILWSGLDGVSIITDGGRVVNFIGGETELRNISNRHNDPLLSGGINGGETYSRVYDIMPGYFYNVKVSSTFANAGKDKIKVLGFNKNLVKVKEKIKFFRTGSKSRTNIFWLDPVSGNVWKSKQYYAPYARPLIVERAFPPFVPDYGR